MSPQQSGPYQSQSLNQVAQIYQNLVDKCTRAYRYLQYNGAGVMQLILVPIFALWAGGQNISKGWQNLLGKKVLNLPHAENFDSDNNFNNNSDNNTKNLVSNNINHSIDFNHDLNNNHLNQDFHQKSTSVKEKCNSINSINSINSLNLSSKKNFVSALENSIKNWVYPVMIGVTSLVPIPDIKPAEKALANLEPAIPSSMTVFTENPGDLAVNNNQNSSQTKISYNEQFLEAHFVPMGYVKHPLELVLEWVDKIIYFVEQLIVGIVNFYRS